MDEDLIRRIEQQCKISVCIPVYNCADYLEECLESVQKQSLNEIEIICFNDGSTDSSKDILNKAALKDPRVKIFSTQNNVGISSARNVMIRAAKGEFIYFLDGDDFINPGALDEMYHLSILYDLNFLTFNSNFYPTDMIDTETQRKNPILDGEYPGVMSGIEFFCRLNENGEYRVAVWRFLFKREFIINNNLFFNESIKCYEDAPFSFACYLKAEKTMYVKKTFHNYRIHPGSIVSSTNDLKAFTGFFQGYAEKLKMIGDFHIQDDRIQNSFQKRINRARNNALKHYRRLKQREKSMISFNGDMYVNELFRLFKKSIQQDITLAKLKKLRLREQEMKQQIEELQDINKQLLKKNTPILKRLMRIKNRILRKIKQK